MYFRTNNAHHPITIQAGFSLLEVTASLFILGIMILIMIPTFSDNDDKKVELAANIIADALRYARSESMRTGDIHGVLIDTNDSEALGRDITVFKADLGQSPFGNQGTLYHPINKQPYDLWLSDNPITRDVKFKNTGKPFSFDGIAKQRYLFFNPQGQPVYVEDGNLFAYTKGNVRVIFGDHDLKVAIQPTTGKVTVK